MRSKFILVLGLAGALLIGACSSDEEKTKAPAKSTSPANASNSSVPLSSVNSNTQDLLNGEVVRPQQVDPNAVAASGDSVMPPMQGRLEKMRNADSSKEGSLDAAALAMKNVRPAPDNSTFTTYLTDAGYEIRSFKKNPVILKVEKKIENSGNQSLTVFLRNGKVVQLPGNAIPVLSTATAESIASAAGISIAPANAPPTGATDTKKPVN